MARLPIAVYSSVGAPAFSRHAQSGADSREVRGGGRLTDGL